MPARNQERTGQVQQRAREAGVPDVDAKNKQQLLQELNSREQQGGRGGRRRR